MSSTKINLTTILESNDPKQIGPYIYNSYLFYPDEVIEKVINVCYNNIHEETFHKFLSNAIFNDKVNVFQIMDKLEKKYDNEYFKKLATLYKSTKCSGYFNV
jgi:hypothetical protein